MKVITEAYKEIATILTNEIADIAWIDMWHNQINFLEDEYAFPFPAVFLSFRAGEMEDISKGDQNIDTFIDVYLAFETLADTYQGAFNQQSALEFGNILQKIHQSLHTRSGVHFGTLRRMSFAPIDTGTGIMLYRVTYNGMIGDCSISDMRACQQIEVANPGYELEKGEKTINPNDITYQIDC
ncbi:MAG: hypothetical protein N4A35_05350 [Flavobacteriales bacterium]|jgi:hypothetical protein|nr:hypothetical protein [Flavobacteriales bacterium]